MDRPQCCAQDASSIGYQLIACTKEAVALFQMDGDSDPETLCLECLQRRIRVAIDIKGFVLRVIAGPMPAAEPSAPAPAAEPEPELSL